MCDFSARNVGPKVYTLDIPLVNRKNRLNLISTQNSPYGSKACPLQSTPKTRGTFGKHTHTLCTYSYTKQSSMHLSGVPASTCKYMHTPSLQIVHATDVAMSSGQSWLATDQATASAWSCPDTVRNTGRPKNCLFFSSMDCVRRDDSPNG